MAFIKVKNDDYWDPRSTPNPDPKLPRIEKAGPSDSDFIDGWLLGIEANQGKDKNSNLYTLMLPDDSAVKSVWGSMVLDEQLSKIKLGSFIRIQWMGKQKPKQAGGRPYHVWEVSYDPDKGLHHSVTATAGGESQIATPATNGQPTPSAKDLPF